MSILKAPCRLQKNHLMPELSHILYHPAGWLLMSSIGFNIKISHCKISLLPSEFILRLPKSLLLPVWLVLPTFMASGTELWKWLVRKIVSWKTLKHHTYNCPYACEYFHGYRRYWLILMDRVYKSLKDQVLILLNIIANYCR